jgi:plastocyanin
MRRPANIHGLLCMALGLLLIMTGCSSASHATGENKLRIVNVGQSVEPHHINAGRGHEVRWRNEGTQPITVIFPGEYADRISCRTGFTSVDKTVLSAVIEPNAFASLCFSQQGRYNYQVRLHKNLASALTEQSATVWIVGRGERNADPYEDYGNITP